MSAPASVEAIRRVHAGQPMLSPEVTSTLIAALTDAPPAASEAASDALALLTDREREVAVLMAQGLTNAQIGTRMHVSMTSGEGPTVAHLHQARRRQPRVSRLGRAGRRVGLTLPPRSRQDGIPLCIQCRGDDVPRRDRPRPRTCRKNRGCTHNSARDHPEAVPTDVDSRHECDVMTRARGSADALMCRRPSCLSSSALGPGWRGAPDVACGLWC